MKSGIYFNLYMLIKKGSKINFVTDWQTRSSIVKNILDMEYRTRSINWNANLDLDINL